MPPLTPARLEPCDLARCEGMCCHDGAWLSPDEVPALRRLVFRRRAELGDLPPRPLVPTGAGGTKTATRPHRYRAALPAHFPATRCVFALPDARCSLQVLAEADGVHPWEYKPRACWMHPLRESAAGLLPPPRDPADDWDRAEGYPGYVTSTECGRHRPAGAVWHDALVAERARWAASPRPDGGPPPGAPPTFRWFELLTPDVEAAAGFYRATLGLVARPWRSDAGGYLLFHAGERPVAGLMRLPAAEAAAGRSAHWLGSVTVAALEPTLARVQALGGAITRSPSRVPGVGRFAGVADPTGAPLVLVEPEAGSPGLPDPLESDAAPEPSRRGAWAPASTFYAELLSWRAPTRGTDGAPAAWGCSFPVPDVEAATARAVAAGGSVERRDQAATAAIRDPAGATFGVHAPAG